MDRAMTVVLGLVLASLGATGATLAARDAGGRASGPPTPGRVLHLVPFGVLVGAGAALVRGWDLGATAALGAVLVPSVAVLGDLLAARSRARRHGR